SASHPPCPARSGPSNARGRYGTSMASRSSGGAGGAPCSAGGGGGAPLRRTPPATPRARPPPGRQPTAQDKPAPLVRRIVLQRRLHGPSAAGGSPCRLLQRFGRVVAGRRPADQQRIAGELQHVTAA